jgi:hypothetical protein
MSIMVDTRKVGFDLLARVGELDSEFVSGPPWTGKERIIVDCGYSRVAKEGSIVPEFGVFHEAYEDARMFQLTFAKELSESTEDPQELFTAFSYVREETFFLDDLVEQLRMFGIDYIFELREEILEDELARCSSPDDL